MGIIALAGLGSGALHAVSGPDHLLSLAPLSLSARRGAWRVGLLWGLGHALGTLLCALAVMWVASALHLEVLESWGERLAGAALLVTGAMGIHRWVSGRRASHEGSRRQQTARETSRGVVTIGFIHGLTGAAAVLLLLPATLSGPGVWRALYLVGFALGSTAAMAALTAGLSASSRAVARQTALLRHVPAVASVGSVALGGWWVLGL